MNKEDHKMQIEKNFTQELLNESWFDITEELDDLIGEWYGEASNGFPDNDIDFNDAVRSLISGYRYWRFNPETMTSYEKLRSKYEYLLEVHQCLIESYNELLSKSEFATARRKQTQLKSITTKTKGGYIKHNGRRNILNDDSTAA
jgi:hypothetical protein